MAAHPFLPFWQAPGFAGRFFCSALCSGHIGVFHTAAGFIWGKRGGKCVKLQAAQHNRYKGVWLCKKRKAGRQRAFLFAFFMISVFACVRFFGNGRSGYSFRSRYSRSIKSKRISAMAALRSSPRSVSIWRTMCSSISCSLRSSCNCCRISASPSMALVAAKRTGSPASAAWSSIRWITA